MISSRAYVFLVNLYILPHLIMKIVWLLVFLALFFGVPYFVLWIGPLYMLLGLVAICIILWTRGKVKAKSITDEYEQNCATLMPIVKAVQSWYAYWLDRPFTWAITKTNYPKFKVGIDEFIDEFDTGITQDMLILLKQHIQAKWSISWLEAINFMLILLKEASPKFRNIELRNWRHFIDWRYKNDELLINSREGQRLLEKHTMKQINKKSSSM